MDIKTFLQKRISYQTKAWGQPEKEITIQEALAEIKNGTLSSQINTLRSILNENRIEDYNILKKKLPGVTFSAAFNQLRRKENLNSYNSVLVLDIDKLDPKELERTKEILQNDSHVFSFWESPSKKGLKGLIAISYNFELKSTDIDSNHLNAFKLIQQEFLRKYNITIDSSGNDTTRLCFLSSDPDLVIKRVLVPYTIEEPEIILNNPVKKRQTPTTETSKHLLYNPTGKNNANNRYRIEAIIKYLKKTNLSITHEYIDWVRVGYAIANAFTYDIAERFFINMSKLDTDKFDEKECKNLLLYCYQTTLGTISFRTITYLAKLKGFKTKEEKGEFLSGSQ